MSAHIPFPGVEIMLLNMSFGCGKINNFSAGVKGGINLVSSCCESDKAWIRLHWSICHGKSEIGRFSSFGDLFQLNEVYITVRCLPAGLVLNADSKLPCGFGVVKRYDYGEGSKHQGLY